MKNNLISIIVPIYNCEKYLDRCIRSLLNQTYKNIEILLLDDGSKDNSLSICKNYEKKYKNVFVYHHDNIGAAATRNKGITLAKGNYIGFVDSDDYVEETMYYNLYNNIIKSNSDISICGRIIEEKDNIIFKSKPNIYLNMNNLEGLKQLNSLKYFDMSPCDKLFRKTIFNKCNFPEGLNSEDFYFMYKAIFYSKKIIYDSFIGYHYCKRENSHSNYCINDSYILASKSQIDFFEKKCPQILYVAKCYDAYANTIQYNKYILHNVSLSKEDLNILKRKVYKNLKYVIYNFDFSFIKKIQILVFIYFTPLYGYLIKKRNDLK